jgi:hypothetical protein
MNEGHRVQKEKFTKKNQSSVNPGKFMRIWINGDMDKHLHVCWVGLGRMISG